LSRCHVTHPNVRYLADYCVLDVRRAAEALGWMPRITLWQGIGDMLARVRVSRDSERHS
jgi:nucleoside-diphosphate-sugar epimerase